MANLLNRPLKLALIQLATSADKAANLARARSKVLEASKNGANLVVLPECFNSPYGTKYFPQYAEQLLPSPPSKPGKGEDGKEVGSATWHALRDMAQEGSVFLVGGSLPEYVPAGKKDSSSSGEKDDGKWYNTSLTFSPDGDLLATHRKVHLFDIDIPGKIRFKESEVLTAGDKITIVDLPGYGKIGIAVCYDIRFPELAMIAARKGAFLLIYPGAFNLVTGERHWTLQARARAVDNQTYVALCSPSRDMEADYNAWGHSLVCDPDAGVVGELDENEGILYADLNGERIEEVRKGIPIYTQRRFDVYSDVSGQSKT